MAADGPKVDRILFPIELSNVSEKVAPWVDYFTRTHQAELHVLHVVPKMEFWGVAYASSNLLEQDYKALAATASQKVSRFCMGHLSARVEPIIEVKVGRPAEVIVEYVDEAEIDLVIMGTHGQHGMDRALFGSTADRVLRSCPVPVTCINPLKYESVNEYKPGKW